MSPRRLFLWSSNFTKPSGSLSRGEGFIFRVCVCTSICPAEWLGTQSLVYGEQESMFMRFQLPGTYVYVDRGRSISNLDTACYVYSHCLRAWLKRMQGRLRGLFRLHHLLRGASATQATVPPSEDREKAVSTQLGDVAALAAAPRFRSSGLNVTS